jgi:hypothetical protein
MARFQKLQQNPLGLRIWALGRMGRIKIQRKGALKMKGRSLALFMIFGLIAAVPGCGGHMIYLINVKYIPEDRVIRKTSAFQPPKMVGICPFKDAREAMDKKIIGLRRRPGKHPDLLKIQNVGISEAVTQAVKDHFEEKGFKVSDCKGWDNTLGGLARLPEEFSYVVGGRIEALMIESRSKVPITETHYKVKITVFIGHTVQGQIITRTIESEPETKKVGFSPDEVETRLNRTLSGAIQEIFE